MRALGAYRGRSGLGGARIHVCDFSGRRYTVSATSPTNEKSPASGVTPGREGQCCPGDRASGSQEEIAQSTLRIESTIRGSTRFSSFTEQHDRLAFRFLTPRGYRAGRMARSLVSPACLADAPPRRDVRAIFRIRPQPPNRSTFGGSYRMSRSGVRSRRLPSARESSKRSSMALAICVRSTG